MLTKKLARRSQIAGPAFLCALSGTGFRFNNLTTSGEIEGGKKSLHFA
jgi:hypothetical protein